MFKFIKTLFGKYEVGQEYWVRLSDIKIPSVFILLIGYLNRNFIGKYFVGANVGGFGEVLSKTDTKCKI